jgi:hypothetical protein
MKQGWKVVKKIFSALTYKVGRVQLMDTCARNHACFVHEKRMLHMQKPPAAHAHIMCFSYGTCFGVFFLLVLVLVPPVNWWCSTGSTRYSANEDGTWYKYQRSATRYRYSCSETQYLVRYVPVHKKLSLTRFQVRVLPYVLEFFDPTEEQSKSILIRDTYLVEFFELNTIPSDHYC